MANPDWIEVCYALPETQRLMRLEFTPMTAEQAIERSGILDEFPEIDLSSNRIGIFGMRVRLGHRLQPGDRVEIYRPLAMTPKQARRMRAEKEI